MRSFGKRAQDLPTSLPSGANAAILIFVIAAFIILYLLFLPKGDRDKLLDTGSSSTKVVAPGSLPGSTLLKENPGVLTKLKDNEFDHKLPSFNLFTNTSIIVPRSSVKFISFRFLF